MIFGLVVMLGGWIAFYYNVDNLVTLVWEEPSAADYDWGWVHSIVHFFWNVVHVLLWIILAAVTVVLSLALFMLAAAPFNDIISEQTEGILGTWEPRPFSLGFLIRDLAQTVLLELTRLGIKAAWLIPLLIISFIIPVVGQLFYVVFGGYLLAKFLGWTMWTGPWPDAGTRGASASGSPSRIGGPSSASARR